MSTTFGVSVSSKIIPPDGDVIEVAFRSNGMRFTNPLAHLLPNDTPVIAMDNTQQGVHTIGDIKKAILETDSDSEYFRTVEVKNK